MSGNAPQRKLTEGFRETIELRWSEFVAMESNPDQSNFDSVIAALTRACAKGNLRAIQVSLDRLDSKIATEIEVEMPKFYTLYPQATKTTDSPLIIEAKPETKVAEVLPTPTVASEPEELPTGSLRAVLERMMDVPKSNVTNILAAAESIDNGSNDFGDPLVKSVIIAGMMKLIHGGTMSALFEVLDQIDGKVVEKFKMLGNDVYLYNYATIAPAGAEKNADGVYQISADNTTNSWAIKLEALNGKNRR